MPVCSFKSLRSSPVAGCCTISLWERSRCWSVLLNAPTGACSLSFDSFDAALALYDFILAARPHTLACFLRVGCGYEIEADF